MNIVRAWLPDNWSDRIARLTINALIGDMYLPYREINCHQNKLGYS